MAETVKILDRDGWPIVEGARVYVPERPGLGGFGLVKGFGGVVREATPERVEIEEFLSFHSRTVKPEQCVVQSGETKTSLEHAAIRKGGRKYIQDRAKAIQQREERNAAKAAKGEK